MLSIFDIRIVLVFFTNLDNEIMAFSELGSYTIAGNLSLRFGGVCQRQQHTFFKQTFLWSIFSKLDSPNPKAFEPLML